MFGSPFFSDFDDGYYRGRPYGNSYRQHAMAGEARRRAELEYYRQKELEEQQERLRQRQEYARRLRQQQLEEEEEYRQAYHAEMERRQQQAERQQALRRKAMQQYSDTSDAEESEDEEMEPEYRLVRGPDGRIYRVQVGTTRKQKEQSKTVEDKENKAAVPPPAANRGRREIPISKKESREEVRVRSEEPEKSLPENWPTASLTKKTKANKKKKTKKRVTVIVEDASDSETESEVNSPWRNRLPSPGEWMEPVEGFEKFQI